MSNTIKNKMFYGIIFGSLFYTLLGINIFKGTTLSNPITIIISIAAILVTVYWIQIGIDFYKKEEDNS